MQDRMTRLSMRPFPNLEGGGSRGVVPPVDIMEKGVRCPENGPPGDDQNEIEIKVEENTLIIQGERKLSKNPRYQLPSIERPFGTFRALSHFQGGLTKKESRPVTRMVCSASSLPKGRYLS